MAPPQRSAVLRARPPIETKGRFFRLAEPHGSSQSPLGAAGVFCEAAGLAGAGGLGL